MTDKLYSQEAEEGLLACALIDPDTLTGLELTPDQFYVDRHKTTFAAMKDLWRRDTPVDVVTLQDHLDQAGKLAEVGGAAFLLKLLVAPVMTYNAPAYAQIIREKARRRRLLQAANELANVAHDDSANLDASITTLIGKLAAGTTVNGGARPLSDYISQLYDEVGERSKDPRDVWGIPSGIGKYDALTGGHQPGELTILSGAPGMGKSILAMQMAAMAGQNAPGSVYSVEMSGIQVARRLVSGHACISTKALKTGRLADGEWPAFTAAVDHFSGLPIYMSDASDWTTASLHADLARLKAQHGIRWFVLDYLFLLKDQGKDEIERTAQISAGLKRICRSLDLAGIVVHSMNKTGIGAGGQKGAESSGGIPGQDQLRGSGQVIYDADVITFLTGYTQQAGPIVDADQKNVRVLWFAKGREIEDERRYIMLVKQPAFPAFREMAVMQDAPAQVPQRRAARAPKHNPADMELAGDYPED